MWQAAGSVGAVGLEIAAYIAATYFAGAWLDRRFGTAPWLMYVSLLFGLGAAVKALVRVNRQYKKSLEKDGPPGPKPPPG